MNWKKSRFSYVMWSIYSLFVGIVLLFFIRTLGLVPGGKVYIEVLLTAGVAAVVGALAVLLRLFTGERRDEREDADSHLQLILEITLAVLLLILGLVLRIKGFPEAGERNMYFETARVTDRQAVPQVVHGASYVYLLFLRGFFLLLGNKFSVGIWLQIVLQFVASILLYLSVRKLAGPFAALTMLIFVTCSGFAVREALVLSPRMLYLLLFAIGIAVISACKGGKLSPFPFFLSGIWMGVISYLDVGGLLLAVPGVAVVFSEWETWPERKKRMVAVTLFLAGGLAGLFGGILTGSIFSGKTMAGVAGEWLNLYRPRDFRMPLDFSGVSPAWGILLILFMTFGIFGFWYNRQRDQLSVWVAMSCVAAVAGCLCMFTDEIPASMYLYLFFFILAGVSVQECFLKEGVETMEENPLIQKEEKEEEITEVLWQAEEISRKREHSAETKPQAPRYIENPLPLPKPHVKRVLDYDRKTTSGKDEYDFIVNDNDDFDIK